MKGVWKWSLGLSLGLLVGRAPGAEAQWRAPDPRPAATLDRPIATSEPAPPAAAPVPAATLSRPVAVGAAPAPGVTDAQVKPVAFSWPDLTGRGALAGAAIPEPPRPMPVGTPAPEEGVLKMPTRIAPEAGPSLDPGFVPPPPSDVGLPPGAILAPPGPGAAPPDGVCGDGATCGGSCCIEADSSCCADGCGCLGHDHTFYISAEYLMWFFKNSPLPPLVTQTLDYRGLTPGAVSDFPHTITVFGGGGEDTGLHSGMRLTGGGWFDDEQCFGLMGSFFFIGQRGAHFTAGSNDSVGFFRPFISQETGQPVAEEVSGMVPRDLAGRVVVDLDQRLWGAEANFRHNLLCGPCYRLDLVEGFRFLDLEESLNIAEQGLTVLDEPTTAGGLPRGTTFQVADRFATQNRFYGGQVGAISEVRLGSWVIDVTGKVGLGDTRQSANIIGNTTIGSDFMPGSFARPGGLLAQPSNMGLHTRDRFSVISELGLDVGYQLTEQLRLYAGYNFLYWSSVMRPGDQIDPVVARSQLPGNTPGIVSPPGSTARLGQLHPVYAFHGTDFWAHGVNFGLEFRY